jgi:hypothetical protein
MSGRAAGGPRRGCVPQALTVQTCVSAGAPRRATAIDKNSSNLRRRED